MGWVWPRPPSENVSSKRRPPPTAEGNSKVHEIRLFGGRWHLCCALAAVRFGDPTRARAGTHKIAGSPASTTSRSHRRRPETGDHLCKLDNRTSSRRRRLYLCSAGGRGVVAKICRLASFSRSGDPPPLLVIRRPYFFFFNKKIVLIF